jgi:hypothetical protein
VPAQDIKNIFAYRHVIPMGTIPRFPKNSDTANKEPRREIPVFPIFNYYIFITVGNQKAPVITNFKLGEKPVKIRLEKMNSLPVVYAYQDGRQEQKITMIDSRQKNVYQLILIDYVPADKKEIPADKISVTYMSGGKTKIISLKRIKEMPAGIRY